MKKSKSMNQTTFWMTFDFYLVQNKRDFFVFPSLIDNANHAQSGKNNKDLPKNNFLCILAMKPVNSLTPDHLQYEEHSFA